MSPRIDGEQLSLVGRLVGTGDVVGRALIVGNPVGVDDGVALGTADTLGAGVGRACERVRVRRRRQWTMKYC